MPTFVSAHTFCASRKAYLRYGVPRDYVVGYLTKMKAKFAYYG